MRIVLPAIEIFQNEKTKTYLSKLTVGQIKELIDSKQIIPDTYNPDINIQKGYQRSLNSSRIKKILNFLESQYKIALSIMPSSIVLSARKSKIEPLKFKDGKLIIGDDARLFTVDGQHRVWGIKEHKNSEYEIPVTIIYGLDEHQEAAQFLIINSTQKKVDPSLQLRVLFYADRNLIEKLIDEIKNVIPWQTWKLEALKIAIDLENDPENPWYKNVKVPNDPTEDWKPIKEGSFVDSFRYMASEKNPISQMPMEKKLAYLKNYWNAIRKLWNKAFEKDYIYDYILASPFGAGVFNTLFPTILTLKDVTDSSFEKMLEPIFKRYPLRSWSRKRGKLSKRGTSQRVYRDTAYDFIMAINPKFDYANNREYDKIRKKTHNLRWLVDKAYGMLDPLTLKSSRYLKNDTDKYKRACYVLVNLKKNGNVAVYVGQSKNIEDRLSSHSKCYNLYHVESCKTEQEMKQLEGTLWHLVKQDVRENKNHPNKEFCPFCQ